MKISIIGAGNIGSTLGKKWAAAGHEVVFGLREPQAARVQRLLEEIDGSVSAGTVAEAGAGVAVILLAVPGDAVPAVVDQLGADLRGRIVIDATNEVDKLVMNSLVLLQGQATGASFYRAFNSLGWENFAEPVLGGVQADLFYCGDEGEGRPVVEQLICDVGLRPVYVGGLEQAPVLDNLTRLWFALALQRGYGRHLAFKLLQGDG